MCILCWCPAPVSLPSRGAWVGFTTLASQREADTASQGSAYAHTLFLLELTLLLPPAVSALAKAANPWPPLPAFDPHDFTQCTGGACNTSSGGLAVMQRCMPMGRRRGVDSRQALRTGADAAGLIPRSPSYVALGAGVQPGYSASQFTPGDCGYQCSRPRRCVQW